MWVMLDFLKMTELEDTYSAKLIYSMPNSKLHRNFDSVSAGFVVGSMRINWKNIWTEFHGSQLLEKSDTILRLTEGVYRNFHILIILSLPPSTDVYILLSQSIHNDWLCFHGMLICCCRIYACRKEERILLSEHIQPNSVIVFTTSVEMDGGWYCGVRIIMNEYFQLKIIIYGNQKYSSSYSHASGYKHAFDEGGLFSYVHNILEHMWGTWFQYSIQFCEGLPYTEPQLEFVTTWDPVLG